MKRIWLVLAIVGAVVPYLFLIAFARDNGLDVAGFFAALFANNAAGMFTVDLVISSVAFWLFMLTRRGPKPWLFIALNLGVGLSCALPAYLYAAAGDE